MLNPHKMEENLLILANEFCDKEKGPIDSGS